MIDLHSHVLPGVDDGPHDFAGSLEMARVAEAAGIEILVATPHVREEPPSVRPEELADRVRELNGALERNGSALKVLSGGEVDLGAALEMPDAELSLVTLDHNGRDLLVETPYGHLSSAFEHALDELVTRGYRLTLAHPERNATFQEDPARLGSLVAAGALVQVTAGSLAGRQRSRSRRLAIGAIAAGWAHVIASDAHSADRRPPRLRPGLDAAYRAGAGSRDELGWMVQDGPAAVLAGRELPARPLPVGSWRRKRLSRYR